LANTWLREPSCVIYLVLFSRWMDPNRWASSWWRWGGEERPQPRSGTRPDNSQTRNVFLQVELYERSKSRPTPSGGARPWVRVSLCWTFSGKKTSR
jgi:hypothetical protein